MPEPRPFLHLPARPARLGHPGRRPAHLGHRTRPGHRARPGHRGTHPANHRGIRPGRHSGSHRRTHRHGPHPVPTPIPMSATLAADEALARRRAAGERVLSMASGEIGLPVLPALADRLAAAATENAYGSVAGSPALRTAVAGYWERRGLPVDPDLVVAGPGSKSLLFAVLLAIGGDVVVPVPSWVSYAAQARLVGARPIPVPILPGEGGVPDPARLREAVTDARASGQRPGR